MVNGYDRSLAGDWLFLSENDFFSLERLEVSISRLKGMFRLSFGNHLSFFNVSQEKYEMEMSEM